MYVIQILIFLAIFGIINNFDILNNLVFLQKFADLIFFARTYTIH